MAWTLLTADNVPQTECIGAILNSKGKAKNQRTGLLEYQTETGSYCINDLIGITHFDMDIYSRDWIIRNSVSIIRRYSKGELTLRALHYQLVGRGMFNTMQHYKRVVGAMEVARWSGDVAFDTFTDLERTMANNTRADETVLEDKIEQAKEQVGLWMTSYRKNRWENQPIYAEIFIEKKALQMMFERTAQRNEIALGAVKGYPSLTFLYEAANRFKEMNERGKQCVILYFGDYDPSGEDIPRSIEENINRMGGNVEVRRFALFEHQVIEWKLPPAPTKDTDSRTANWDGLGQVELDAVDREVLQELTQSAIDSVFDRELHDELLDEEETEQWEFERQLKEYVNNL
jgi:hypothetical protein